MSIKNGGILTFSAIAALTLCAPPVRADLVANGGFCSTGPACAASGGDFNGWTTTGSGDPYYTNTISLGSGLYAAQIGAYYPDSGTTVVQGSISQTLATVVGQTYNITFLYGEYNANPSTSSNNPYNPSDPNNPANCSENGCYLDSANVTSLNDPYTDVWAQNNNLNVEWGGTSAGGASNFFTSTISGPNNTDGGRSIGDYFVEEGTATVVASSTSTVLEFDADDVQQSVIITDVSVVAATPEPGFILPGSALLGLGLLARRRFVRRTSLQLRG